MRKKLGGTQIGQNWTKRYSTFTFGWGQLVTTVKKHVKSFVCEKDFRIITNNLDLNTIQFYKSDFTEKLVQA